MTRDSLDKYQIATVRLADAVYNFFAGAHPATVADSTRAVRELLKGVYKFYHKKGLLAEMDFSDDDPALKILRLSSNFSKHADNDANKLKAYGEFINAYALSNAAENYLMLSEALTEAGLIDTDFMVQNFIDEPFPDMTKATTLTNIFSVWSENMNEGLVFVLESLEDVSSGVLRLVGQEKADIIKKLDQNLSNLEASKAVLEMVSAYADHMECRRDFLDLILKHNLWPVEYHGGTALLRNEAVKFDESEVDLSEFPFFDMDAE